MEYVDVMAKQVGARCQAQGGRTGMQKTLRILVDVATIHMAANYSVEYNASLWPSC